MKNLKQTELQDYAEQKTLDYVRRNLIDKSEVYISDEVLIDRYTSEYNTCMDLFIAGCRFSEGLNDFEEQFEYTQIPTQP